MHLNQGDFSKRRCIENLCISYALVFENRDAFHGSTQPGINLNPTKRSNPNPRLRPNSFFVLSAAKTGWESPVRYRIVNLAVCKANAAGLKDAHLFDGYELEACIDEGRDDALGGFGR